MSHDGWKAIRPLLNEAIEPLRTENETLRAERDAAIARAEEAERLKETNRKLHRRMQIVEGPMAARVARGEREAAFWLEARKEAGRRASYALFRANRAETEAARLTSKLAQAEGEIATMRAGLEAIAARDHWGAIKGQEPMGAEMKQFLDGYNLAAQSRSARARDALAALTNPEPPHGD
ncbi:hypothetical protein [Methylobacterium sp. CM6247]